MAPLQKRAWLGLGIGVAASAAIVALLVTRGATSFNEDDETRWIFYALVLGMLIAWVVLLAPALRRSGRTRVFSDERDEVVIRRATQAQLCGTIGVVVAWSIALTEVYSDRGEIPIVFPNLIFWTVIVVNMLAQALGILINYRRMG
jgi:H+/Cl- antiporter ClcA